MTHIMRIDEMSSMYANQATNNDMNIDNVEDIVEVIGEYGYDDKMQDIVNVMDSWWNLHKDEYDKNDYDNAADNLCQAIASDALADFNDDTEEFEDMCFNIAEALLGQN